MLRPQGRRGEVRAALHTDFPERFEERRRLSGLATDGSRRELQVEAYWFHKGGVVLKFAGVESISDAARLAGMEVQVPGDERAELDAGAAYVSELVGCEVWVSDVHGRHLLGAIAEVQFGAGEAPLLVVRGPTLSLRDKGGAPSLEEFLVPYAEEFVITANLGERRIEMQLPDGLLELEAPLDAEEKQRQKAEADATRIAGVRGKRRR